MPNNGRINTLVLFVNTKEMFKIALIIKNKTHETYYEVIRKSD